MARLRSPEWSRFLTLTRVDAQARGHRVSGTGDLCRLTATEQLDLVVAGEVSAEELTRAALARIEQANPVLNAVVTLNESALDDARALDVAQARGDALGPLHGLGVGIKDVTPVKDLRTTYGSELYRDNVATVDALVVERFRAAGAVILGKTNTPEFATGGNTFNPVFGRTRNPWNPEMSAGGSTGGGACALASGMIALAEGTDLGGSLRIPASFCGVVGLRPSPGLIPTWPSEFLADDMQVTGTMARSARDIALSLDALHGPSDRVPVHQPNKRRSFLEGINETALSGKRLGYCPDIADVGIDADVEQVCRKAAFELRQLGAEVQEIEFHAAFAKQAFMTLRGLWMVTQQLQNLESLEQFGDNLRGNVESGLRVTALEIARAQHDRARLIDALRRLFESVDFLITPSMAVSPFPVTENFPATVGGREMETYVDWIAPTFVLSLTALPVASVPCGLDGMGLPCGLQIVGPAFSEDRVLGAAHCVQQVAPIGLPE